MTRHLLRSADLDPTEQHLVVTRALELARVRRTASAGGRAPTTDDLAGRSIALVFERPSLRTRVSLEVAVTELGGHAVKIDDAEIRLGVRESVADTARVLSRYVSAIVLRTSDHARLEELAAHADVPVVNALSDVGHPLQALADLSCVTEQLGDLVGRTITFVGDGHNNVAHSLLVAAAQAGMHVRVAHPPGYAPDPDVVAVARDAGGGEVVVTDDVGQAVAGTDVVATDVWASMGQEEQRERRLADFEGYQVTSELLAGAAEGVVVLHCLPAHRGEEIAADVIDGPASRVWLQAEHRLHTAKAVLLHLLEVTP